MLEEYIRQLLSATLLGREEKCETIYRELESLGMDRMTARVLMKEMYNENKRKAKEN